MRSPSGFSLTMAIVIVVGVLGVVWAKSSRVARAEPGVKIGEHWHAALGVNVCGQWLPNPPQFESDVHTHGDGLIHLHPQSSAGAGRNGTTGTFLKRGGWKATATELKVWDGKTHRNGQKCQGKPAEVRWAVDGKERFGDPSPYILRDRDTIVLAFLPKDADLPKVPPSAAQLQNISDLPGAGAPGSTPAIPPPGTPPPSG